jgi:hypothetical protein
MRNLQGLCIKAVHLFLEFFDLRFEFSDSLKGGLWQGQSSLSQDLRNYSLHLVAFCEDFTDFTFSSIISPSFSLCCKSSRVYPKSRAWWHCGNPNLLRSYSLAIFSSICTAKKAIAKLRQLQPEELGSNSTSWRNMFANVFQHLFFIFPKCSNT